MKTTLDVCKNPFPINKAQLPISADVHRIQARPSEQEHLLDRVPVGEDLLESPSRELGRLQVVLRHVADTARDTQATGRASRLATAGVVAVTARGTGRGCGAGRGESAADTLVITLLLDLA